MPTWRTGSTHNLKPTQRTLGSQGMLKMGEIAFLREERTTGYPIPNGQHGKHAYR